MTEGDKIIFLVDNENNTRETDELYNKRKRKKSRQSDTIQIDTKIQDLQRM